MRVLYPIVASIAGSITALGFRPFKEMAPIEIGMTLFIGAAFAYFCGPLAVKAAQSLTGDDVRLQGGIFYLLATGSNAFIPLAVRWGARTFGFRQEDGK
jgi:hypothetical protein